jgi:hypothetical protein
MKRKIFGIGLMRTGTVSCAEALRILGYNVAHFDELKKIMQKTGGWLAGDYKKDWLGKYDAAFDNPIPIIFPRLDKGYPDSKFILTVRSLDSWLESCEKYLAKVPSGYEYRKMVRTAVYGRDTFNERVWREIYQQHHERVSDYFWHRPNDLLEIRVCNGEGWDKLCRFLGKSVPEKNFPRLNAHPDYLFE